VFVVEQMLTRIPEQGGVVDLAQQEAMLRQIRNSPFEGLVQGVDLSTHESIRHGCWGKILQFLFRHPQGVLMVMLLGIIAPPLISQDVRSRAFLLYFSRPINRWEYILGKASTIWVFLTLITVIPAFFLYILGVLLSPSANVVLSTWDLPFRIVFASGLLMIPTASLALCLSSMTQESRVAAFAWFAIWILGFIAFQLINANEQANRFSQQMADAELQYNADGTMTMVVPTDVAMPPISNWTYISLYDTLGLAQSWAFGFESFERARTAIVILAIVTAISIAVLYRKVSAPMRA
jgi:ABC-type transport system involved in multi-copper enzyme maturation permease subunit